MKSVKAWAVVNKKTKKNPSELAAYGNGEEFQLPVFQTRDYARSFRDRNAWHNESKVVPCMIVFNLVK